MYDLNRCTREMIFRFVVIGTFVVAEDLLREYKRALDETGRLVLETWRLRSAASREMSHAQRIFFKERESQRKDHFLSRLGDGARQTATLVDQLVDLGMQTKAEKQRLGRARVNLTGIAGADNVWTRRYVDIRPRDCKNPDQRNQFKQADVSGDNVISPDEFLAVVHDANETMSSKEAFFNASIPRPVPDLQLSKARPAHMPQFVETWYQMRDADRAISEMNMAVQMAAAAVDTADAFEAHVASRFGYARSLVPSVQQHAATAKLLPFFAGCADSSVGNKDTSWRILVC